MTVRTLARTLLLVAAVAVPALPTPAHAEDTANAITERRGGVDVYILSRPVRAYDVLESGKTLVLADCNEVVNKPIKRAADKGGDGVIIYFETARFDIIKYK